ncbi:MAG: NAD(P)-dependent oxidoreductase, partial [Dongiaceae bacterium]
LQISSLAARERNLSPYAASKRAGEDHVAALAGERPWAILRPPAVYGPGDPATLPLFRAASLGYVPYPAAPGTRLSLIHVGDLSAAITHLVQSLMTGRAGTLSPIEIDDGHVGGYDWTQILETLSTVTGRRIHAVRLPRWLMVGVAYGNAAMSRLTGQVQVLMPPKVAELYHPDWVVRGIGLPAEIGWQPRFDLETGFRDTLAWYREHSFVT